MNIKITPDKYDEILRLAEKETVAEISHRFFVAEKTIRKILRKLGSKIDRRVFNLKDESYFEKIDSHEKAYILGLMYSDGYVRKNHSFGITLHRKDADLLEYMAKALNFSGKIREVKSHDHLSLEICSKKICGDLNNLGCPINKSLILDWPLFLEDTPYIWSFILGVIDGDGHIQNYDGTVACKITGAVKFCNGLIEFLARNDINSGIHSYKNPLTKDAVIYSANAIALFRKILENQSFSLKRKRQIMEYRVFCADFLMCSKRYLIRGTFSKEAFDMFKDGKREELIEFVRDYSKDIYKKHGEKAKTTWVNQFTSAKQKALDREANTVNIAA